MSAAEKLPPPESGARATGSNESAEAIAVINRLLSNANTGANPERNAMRALLRGLTSESTVDGAIDDLLRQVSNGIITVKAAIDFENACPEASDLLWTLHRLTETAQALVALSNDARRT